MAGQKHAMAVAAAPKPLTVARRGTVTGQRNKTFNCIVDESALIDGVVTESLFQPWIRNNYIRVFVPLQSTPPQVTS
jgi:hypothetical protein